jgi:ribosomal-protein-alanine N-acetyltransferase
MPLCFRKMEYADLDEVYSIESEVFSDPWQKEIFEMEMEHDAFVLVKDEQIAGYICAWQVLDECTITNISVRPVCQRQGLGAVIFGELFNLMEQRKVSYYYLEVRASNQAALGLYVKLGFSQIGLRKNYYHNPSEDAIVMTLVSIGNAKGR